MACQENGAFSFLFVKLERGNTWRHQFQIVNHFYKKLIMYSPARCRSVPVSSDFYDTIKILFASREWDLSLYLSICLSIRWPIKFVLVRRIFAVANRLEATACCNVCINSVRPCRLRVYVNSNEICFPAHCAGVTNMIPRYNLSPAVKICRRRLGIRCSSARQKDYRLVCILSIMPVCIFGPFTIIFNMPPVPLFMRFLDSIAPEKRGEIWSI